MKLISMIHDVGEDPERVVIVDGDRTYTRRQARDAVAHCVADLRRLGVRPGERVLALLDHDPRGVFFLAAASALGIRLVMPYNLESAALHEWATIVAHARLDRVISLKAGDHGVETLRRHDLPVAQLGRFEDRSRHAVAYHDSTRRRRVDSFLVLFTSGTTGSPKAVSISEELVCRRVASVAGKLSFAPGSRVLMSGLLNNTTGVIFSFGALGADATLIFPRQRDAGTWPAQVAGQRVTHVMLRPAAMRRFVDSLEAAPQDVSSLRVVAYGAAAVPGPVLERGRRLVRCEWVQGYGLSETYGPFCWLDEQAHREGRHIRSRYCVGAPDPTVEVDLLPVDGHVAPVGEVAVRSNGIMEGYYDVATGGIKPPAEWFRTGDLGEWNPEGDLLLKGRLSGSVLSANGHRIYPEEVEAALCEVPGVEDAAVLGVAVEHALVERPVAFVQGPLAGRPGKEIREVVARGLYPLLSPEKWPDFLYPTAVPFATGTNGKTVRADLRALMSLEELIPFGCEMGAGSR